MLKCVCVVLNYNDAKIVQEFIKRVENYKNVSNLIIVDNNSTDNSYRTLHNLYKDNSKISVIKVDENKGYGFGNNIGVSYSWDKFKNEYTLISNPDVIFTDEMLGILLDVIRKKDAAVVSGVQLTKDKKEILDKSWKIPTIFEYIFNNTKLSRIMDLTSRYPQEYFSNSLSKVDCVPGAMLLVNTMYFKNIGGYDEDMFLYGEETTLGYKLKKANYSSFIVNDVSYVHIGSTSTNKVLPQASKKLRLIYNSRLFFMKKYLKINKVTYFVASKVYTRIVKKVEKREKV